MEWPARLARQRDISFDPVARHMGDDLRSLVDLGRNLAGAANCRAGNACALDVCHTIGGGHVCAGHRMSLDVRLGNRIGRRPFKPLEPDVHVRAFAAVRQCREPRHRLRRNRHRCGSAWRNASLGARLLLFNAPAQDWPANGPADHPPLRCGTPQLCRAGFGGHAVTCTFCTRPADTSTQAPGTAPDLRQAAVLLTCYLLWGPAPDLQLIGPIARIACRDGFS